MLYCIVLEHEIRIELIFMKIKGDFMRILLIEDDKRLCDSLKFQLEKEGFFVDVCHDGYDGLHYGSQKAHDLILLDRMLPTMNGLWVLRKLRDSHIKTPVILLTALGELFDRVEGLECGADDYIVKPFEFPELLARIRCILRRSGKWEETDLLAYEDITYDVSLRQLSLEDKTLLLSKREGSLFELFLRNPNQTLTRSLILTRVWGPDAEVEDGNLDNYIHFIRRRLKALNSRLVLKTVRGVGYRLEKKNEYFKTEK